MLALLASIILFIGCKGQSIILFSSPIVGRIALGHLLTMVLNRTR
jgi:hypothetical protein